MNTVHSFYTVMSSSSLHHPKPFSLFVQKFFNNYEPQIQQLQEQSRSFDEQLLKSFTPTQLVLGTAMVTASILVIYRFLFDNDEGKLVKDSIMQQEIRSILSKYFCPFHDKPLGVGRRTTTMTFSVVFLFLQTFQRV